MYIHFVRICDFYLTRKAFKIISNHNSTLWKKYDEIEYFNELREMLIPYAFWEKNGEILDEYGDGLNDHILHLVMSSYLGGIDITEEMKKRLGVQYQKYGNFKLYILAGFETFSNL